MRTLFIVFAMLSSSFAKAGTYQQSYNCAVTVFEVDAAGAKPVSFGSFARVYPKYGLSQMDAYTDSVGNQFTFSVYNGWLGAESKGKLVVVKNGVEVWNTADVAGQFVQSKNLQNVMISFGCNTDQILF